MNKILLVVNYISIVLVIFLSISYIYLVKENNIYNNNVKESFIEEQVKITNISITAVGDCTIGYDDTFGYDRSFIEVYDKNGYEHFFSNVKHIFQNDDITVANLEGTLTNATVKRVKAFNFKSEPHYVEILKYGDIDVVNIANNHIYDYNDIGYNDTINTLKNANINYFGFENIYIYEKDDIKIGFAGIYCIEDMNCTSKIDEAINKLKNEVNTIILSFHWGIESSYKQSNIQTYLAHYAIDNGVELVLGHHPHVLQGIELYKDKYIVYSLGNFSFGGNQNPSDKDTMIFNINYNYKNGILEETIVKILPASVSSVSYVNDYKPTILENDEYERVMKKIQQNSIGILLE